MVSFNGIKQVLGFLGHKVVGVVVKFFEAEFVFLGEGNVFDDGFFSLEVNLEGIVSKYFKISISPDELDLGGSEDFDSVSVGIFKDAEVGTKG